jgi:hypothetical protein
MEKRVSFRENKSRTRDRKEARFILTQDRDIEVKWQQIWLLGQIKHQENTVAKYMNKLSLISHISKIQSVYNNSKHKCLLVSISNREFSVREPSKPRFCLSLISRVKTRVLYVITVLNGYNRKIIGWSIRKRWVWTNFDAGEWL